MNWSDEIKSLKLPPLRRGSHYSPQSGVCAMEMVAFLERLPHSDKPECTCPVLAAFVRSVNDMLSDDERQRLLPYLPRLVGTVALEHAQARGEYLAWQAIRVFAPIALRATGLHDHAATLEAQTDLRSAAVAADAAYAAAYAADAARAAYAAAYAADAARAADAADAAAAYAARAARAAARTEIVAAMFAALDGVLLIGAPAPREWPRERIAELEKLSTTTA